MPLITPDTRSIYWAIELGNVVLKTGVTPIAAITATGYVVRQSESENDLLGELSGNESDFPTLPAQGEPVEAGQIYNNAGALVLCRQSHNRTVHPPADIPALFVVYRAESDGYLDWVVNESLALGTVRRDPIDGKLYITIQPVPVTVVNQEPSKVPAVWNTYTPPVQGGQWVDSGETFQGVIAGGIIRVTNTTPFSGGQQIRINGTIEIGVISIWTPGVSGLLQVSETSTDLQFNTPNGSTIEVWQ